MRDNILNMLASVQSLENEYYSNLHTVFSSTGTQAQILGKRPCFGNVLKYTFGNMHNTYSIITYKDLIRSANNLCIYTKEEIEKYLTYIKDFIPFEFTVEEFEADSNAADILEEAAHYKIFVDINGPHLKHVFILTLIRYLYETPYKYILLEAFRMKEQPEFSKINLLNLYNVVMFSIDWSTIRGIRPSTDMSHYIGTRPRMLLKKEEIADRIEHLDSTLEELPWTIRTPHLYERNAGCIDLFPIIDCFDDKEILLKNSDNPNDRIKNYSSFGFKFIIFDIGEKGQLLDTTIINNTEEKFKKRLNVYANNLQIIASTTTEAIIKDSLEFNKKNLSQFYVYNPK